MTISVVLVTRDRAALLSDTLDQLARQRFEGGDEVIVMDNGSTDGTADRINSATSRFRVPLRRMYYATPGKTAALNAALAGARGDILALTDDDVLVANDWIETIRRLFSELSLDLVGGRVDPRWERPVPGWLVVDEDGHFGEMASPLALLHYGEAQQLGARTAVGANLIVRRQVYDALDGFDPRLGRSAGNLLCGEDHDFCQRAVAAGFRCEYRPEIRVQHWVPANRMRLLYHLRWFFYSGMTNAILDRSNGRRADRRKLAPRYFWRQLLTSPAKAALLAVMGERARSARALTHGAFALGYIAQRLREDQRHHARSPQLPTTFGVNG